MNEKLKAQKTGGNANLTFEVPEGTGRVHREQGRTGKTYSSPKLTCFGSIAGLTQAGSGKKGEGAGKDPIKKP